MNKDRKTQSQLKGYREDDQHHICNQAVDNHRRPDIYPATGIELAKSMSFDSCIEFGLR